MTTSNYSHTSNAVKFSIIMPCYNSQAYVKSALESIANQTYPNWELIAINDGSKDATLEILTEYASKDSRIRVFSKTNGGYVSAVNMGLEKISGDYFLMLGSDDGLSVTLFEELYEAAGDKLPDCIAFRTVKYQNGNVLGIDSITDFSETVYAEESFCEFNRRYPKQAAIFSSRDTSKCFKRELLEDLRYFGKYGMDADGIFSMLLCHKASSFMSVPADGYYWTLRSDSLSGRKTFLAQEYDRVDNWIEFYNRLSAMKDEAIADTEKGYLYIFAEILAGLWKNNKFSLQLYRRVKQAGRVICKTVERFELDAESLLSRNYVLLIHAPVIWRLYDAIPLEVRMRFK